MSEGLYVPRRTAVNDGEINFGICLWKLPEGGYIMDSQQNYLTAQGRLGDKSIEQKMKDAARNCGVDDGEPFWLQGFRKISQSEWEDQMDLLLTGHNPDPVDIFHQLDGKS